MFFGKNYAKRFLFGGIIFITLSAFFTEKGLREIYNEQKKLDKRLESLQIEKEQALNLNKVLTQMVNSQSDPEWVELVLKRELDLIEEGQIKIFFKPAYSE